MNLFRRNTSSLILALGMSSLLVHCASPGKDTAIGAGAGGATGAVVGGIAGGWKGAAIGAAIGGVAGGAVGNMLDKQANELAKVAETKRTKEGILVNLKNDLLFETNSAVLKDAAIQDLTKLADILVKYPQDRIKVEGFTDNVGKRSYNEQLSLRRAEAVKAVLQGRGVKDSQMMVLGFGPEKPIASNQTSQGKAMNRRVELHIDVPTQVS